MATKWSQNGEKMAMANGEKMAMKMATKWRQNGDKMAKKWR